MRSELESTANFIFFFCFYWQTCNGDLRRPFARTIQDWLLHWRHVTNVWLLIDPKHRPKLRRDSHKVFQNFFASPNFLYIIRHTYIYIFTFSFTHRITWKYIFLCPNVLFFAYVSGTRGRGFSVLFTFIWKRFFAFWFRSVDLF